MADVKLRVLSGSHSYKENGVNKFIKKGEEFVGDESLLKAFGDKLELVEEPPQEAPKPVKRRGRKPKKVEAVENGESNSDGSQRDSNDQSGGCSD